MTGQRRTLTRFEGASRLRAAIEFLRRATAFDRLNAGFGGGCYYPPAATRFAPAGAFPARATHDEFHFCRGADLGSRSIEQGSQLTAQSIDLLL
jgi:hypothetical protein